MANVGEPFYCEYGRPWWSDGNEPPSELNPEPLPRGYYPVREDGSVDTAIRLRWVDDAPDDPMDGAGHFEVMPREAGYGYFHKRNDGGEIPEGTVVPLQAETKGKPKLGAKLARSLGITYIIGRGKKK